MEYDSIFSFKYSRRPNTSALLSTDRFQRKKRARRLAIVQEKQRAIQIRRNAAYVGAWRNAWWRDSIKATGQWIGRTSQNKTLNFLRRGEEDLRGRYVEARVTRAGSEFARRRVCKLKAGLAAQGRPRHSPERGLDTRFRGQAPLCRFPEEARWKWK